MAVLITKTSGNRKGQKMIGICPICNIEFQVTNKWGARRKSCLKCVNKSISSTLKRKGIMPPTQRGKRWGVDYPMENHNWWKGGITPIRGQIWHSTEFQSWRNTIFERDNYTCQLCHKRGGSLQVDHFPVTFSEILSNKSITSLEEAVVCDELWDINNGRTLCVSCHRLTPTYGVNQRFRKESVHES